MDFIVLKKLLLIFLFVAFGFVDAKTPANIINKKILFCIWNTNAALNKKGEHLPSGSRRLRGSSVYKINLYKKLMTAGVPIVALIVNDAELEKEFEQLGFHCYGCKLARKQKSALAAIMKAICTKEKIALIHCHDPFETTEAIAVAREYPVKIVKTVHVDNHLHDGYLRYVDGVMCVSPESAQLMGASNKEKHLNLKHIIWTAPFFDEERFLNFVPTEDKKTFFKREFGVELKDCPMICSVANFYPSFKNHTVLLKAIAKLLYEYQLPVQLVLAGIGPRMDEMKRMAKDLGIDDFVYFVGHTTKTPELYFCSDINALTSNSEALGIVLLEGALLKKPLIGTAGTGMEAVVKHDQTGFLFKPNDVNDLAAQFAKLLTDTPLANKLGAHASQLVRSHFLSNVSLKKVIDFYGAVLQ